MKYYLLIFLFCKQIGFAQHPYVLDLPVIDSTVGEELYTECFARCLVQTSTYEGYFSMTLLPIEWDSSLVELMPAYTYYVVRKDTVLVDSKGEKVRIVPPKYEIVKKYTRFEYQRFAILRKLDSITDRVCLYSNPKLCIHLCMIEVPPEPKYYQVHQLIEPAKIIRQRGKTQTIEVLDSTSTLLEKKIVPPQYAMNKTCDARKQKYRIESDFDFRQYLGEWRRIICCMRGPSATVSRIQLALNQRGYLVKITDVMDRKTKKALRRFQKDRGLPIGNLDPLTLKALGLNPLD
jgi:hypothetical protein